MAPPSLLPAAWIALLAGLLTSALPGQGGAATLESYLERARLEREALFERLAPQVGALLARVAGSEEPPTDASVDELARLGPEATPLLVAHLDPESAEQGPQRVADYVARALELMEPSPVVTDLLRLLERGSPAGRLRAARVLGAVPDPTAVVRPALRSAFEASSGPLKLACLRSLVELGASEDAALLAEVLGAEDDELVAMALGTLTETRDQASAPEVARLLADPARAARHLAGLLAYYRALPELADEGVLLDLVRLLQESAPREGKLAVLRALPDLAPRLTSLRRSLAPLADSTDRDLREAAQAALAILGDRTARRDLLAPYDEVIARNKRWSEAWVHRADAHRRIRDYDAAIRDYREALDVADGNPGPDRESFLGLARCYSLKDRPREAAEWLRRAPITLEELRALAADPDFKALRDSRWGPEAFALGESP